MPWEEYKNTWVLGKKKLFLIVLYIPTVWHFWSSKSLYKIEKIQQRALRLLLNDFAGDIAEPLKNQVKPQ